MRWGFGAVRRDSAADSASGQQHDGKTAQCRREFATFREFYRSRDGRIVVFEDAEGHLTAVNASRLA